MEGEKVPLELQNIGDNDIIHDYYFNDVVGSWWPYQEQMSEGGTVDVNGMMGGSRNRTDC